MPGALHDRLRALQREIRTESLHHSEIPVAVEQIAQLRETEFLVELRVPAAHDIEIKPLGGFAEPLNLKAPARRPHPMVGSGSARGSTLPEAGGGGFRLPGRRKQFPIGIGSICAKTPLLPTPGCCMWGACARRHPVAREPSWGAFQTADRFEYNDGAGLAHGDEDAISKGDLLEHLIRARIDLRPLVAVD